MATRVGVIGCGRIGMGAHLRNYARMDNVIIKALCDIDDEALEKAASLYKGAETYTNAHDLLENGDVDAVSICTPNDCHAELSVAALRAGKHVLCEKPMAMDVREAEKMLQEAERANSVHMLSFTHRFNPTMVFIREMIREGRLGRLYHFRVMCSVDRLMNYDVGLEWRMIKERTGTGVLGDLGSHMIDLSTFLMGDYAGPIEEVAGMMSIFVSERRRLDGQGFGPVTADDAASFLARYRQGVMGVFELSRFSPSKVHLEIDGEKGSVRYDSQESSFIQVKFKESFGDYFAEFKDVEVPISFLDSFGYTREMFFNEVSTFIQGIEQGRQVKPDFEDGLLCQKVIDAVALSAKTKAWQKV